jgi:signal transduction histidine kinase
MLMRAPRDIHVVGLIARIGRWQERTRWYVFALGYLAAVKLAATVVHRVTLGAILLSTWAQAGEEIDTFACLESSFDQRRRLTAELSHELRRPLPVTQGFSKSNCAIGYM